MKKLKLLIVALLSLIILPSIVSAASGKITVSGTTTSVVGNKVTVTVTLSSSTKIGSWQMQLNYDKKYLQLTSSSAEAGGTVMASSTATGVKSKKYTFTFKTLKTGSTTVSVGSYLAYAFDDLSEMSLSAGSKKINIITQAELEASYSKDNNLKGLNVEGYEISPAFDKDTLSYTVNVPEGTTNVTINALENDSKASVSGDGTITVTEGINNVNIVVRAENGSEKTYSLVINVIDQNPINVEIDNISYTVIKLRNNYVCPELFENSEVTINGFQIPACVNEKIKYTLVGLKREDGTIEHFIYDNGKYIKYNEVVGTSLKIIALDYDGKLDGLEKTAEKINDIEYQVFKFNNSEKFYVVYGMNVETGEKDFYVYDVSNKTFSFYDTEYIDYLKEQNETYLYVIIAFGVGLFLSLICVISLSRSKRKLKKKHKQQVEEQKDEINKKSKKDKKKKEKEELEEAIIKEDINELNEIVSEDEDTAIYNLFEDDKKSKKKKKK